MPLQVTRETKLREKVRKTPAKAEDDDNGLMQLNQRNWLKIEMGMTMDSRQRVLHEGIETHPR